MATIVSPLAVQSIHSRGDVHAARRLARSAATSAGITDAEALERISLAVSELASNLMLYTTAGIVTVAEVEDSGRHGIEIRGDDDGPGIADIDAALRDGVSASGRGMGSGLPAMRRLVDEFALESSSAGTHITLRVWVPR